MHPPSPIRVRLSLAAVAAVAVQAAAPSAVAVAFGGDPRTTATLSFASNASATTPAWAWVSPAPTRWDVGTGTGSGAGGCAGAPAGVATLPAEAADASYANSAGLRTVFRVRLSALAPATTYAYSVCWDGGEASAPRTFTTLAAAGTAAQPRVIFWGDLGRDGGGQAFPALEAEAAATAARAPGAGDVAIAAGDFAYNLGDLNGARGAAFMDRFSNISSLLPGKSRPRAA